MKKILVPTDFSENSRSAFLYAMELAERINATVTIAHCHHPSTNHANDFYIFTDEELENISANQLDLFVEQSFSKSMNDVVVAEMVEQKLLVGFAADKLVEISKSGEYDLIVMGATGSTGILEHIFGKVSLHVSQHAACPVLLIPAGVVYSEIKNIMFASEFEFDDVDVLLELEEFSKKFDAKVHLVHVYQEGEATPDGLGHYLIGKNYKLKAPSLNFKIASIANDSVANGLDEFVKNNNMDWMVVVKPKRKFWQQLFHKSKTNKIIKNPEIPLMVMHK